MEENRPPWSHFIVASSSELKCNAVRSCFGPPTKVDAASADTGAHTTTPQPIGLEQALECIDARIRSVFDASDCSAFTPILAIESFIDLRSRALARFKRVLSAESRDRWCDATCIVLQHPFIGRRMIVSNNPYFLVDFPDEFQIPFETTALAETIGDRIHAKYPLAPSNDWYKFVGHTHTRAEVIVRLLDYMFKSLRAEPSFDAVVAEHPMRTFLNFPTQGIEFADLFSLTVHPSFNEALYCRVRKLVKHVCTADTRAQYCVVGLESRGLMLGYAIALSLGMPFVPARKPGKLPGHLVQESYSKEYGFDTLEMQTDYVEQLSLRYAIVVDDVVATGGSLLAACKLCEKAGLEVKLCALLADIPALREQWRAALKGYNISVLSGVPVIM